MTETFNQRNLANRIWMPTLSRRVRPDASDRSRRKIALAAGVLRCVEVSTEFGRSRAPLYPTTKAWTDRNRWLLKRTLLKC